MSNISKNSFLISLEGIEGSGKSTQIAHMKKYFTEKKFEVLTLREPGGTSFGESLRAAILNSTTTIYPQSEALLFASSRAQLLQERILPFLERPRRVLILDRYVDSSVAYQGFARGLGAEYIKQLHSHHPLNIKPHLSFYLKIDLKTSLERMAHRGNTPDYFEKENRLFFEKLIQGYDFCAEEEPKRIKTIDAGQGEVEVAQAIRTHLEARIHG